MTRISNFINSSLVKTDKVLDYVPVVSTFTNLVDLCQKFILKTPIKFNTKNVYTAHLNNKSFLRCAILLVPVVGNVLNLFIYNNFKGLLNKKNDSSTATKKQHGINWNAANHSNPVANATYLKKLWQEFEIKHTHPDHPQARSFRQQRLHFEHNLKNEYSSFSRSIPSPCSLFANPMLGFKESQDVFFIPDNDAFNPTVKTECSVLIDSLRASFGSGKKMLVTQLANNIHAVAAGFKTNGEFKIIDSMGGKTVDMKALTKVLNEAKIKNLDGKLIKFKGEYVNTYIQKGGHECLRFSMLYCYQMAKRLDLNAYQEINGAFLEGKLVKYEDFSQIETVKKVKDIGSSVLVYKPFMRSWALRICGFQAHDWKQIPLSELVKPIESGEGQIGIYALKSDDFPKGCCFKKGLCDLILEDEHGNEISIFDENISLGKPLSDSSATIESLSPKVSGTKHFLILNKGNEEPHLFRPLPGQKLYGIEHLSDGQIRKFSL